MTETAMGAAIALRGVRKRYDGFALRDIDLTLPTGQVMGLVGVNGAGKSTLLRMLMGLVRADGGTVEAKDIAERLGVAAPKLKDRFDALVERGALIQTKARPRTFKAGQG